MQSLSSFLTKEPPMKVLAIRHCVVHPEAAALAAFLDRLGMPRRPMPDCAPDAESTGFGGAIFPAGESWVEVWPAGPEMPACTMLQIVVDDADRFAAHARSGGLEISGPTDAHGERIYFATTPGGVQLSFQSALPDAATGAER
jgi:hypothetical protein